MKAARVTVSTRALEIVDLPIPQPERDEIRIKVEAAGVCLSDVHFLDGTLSPIYLKGDVVTLGHEVAGVVDAVGAEVTAWKPGQRVLISAGFRDEHGRIHTRGFDFDGGYAEYALEHQSRVIEIPDHLSFNEACILADALSTPWAAITSTAQIKAGEAVGVWGLGGLGLHAVQLLRLVGAAPIIAIDPLPAARARALKIGADLALSPDDDVAGAIKGSTSGRGLNAAFDFAGVTAVRKQALPLLAEAGRLVIVGLAGESLTIPNDIAFAYKRTAILGHYGSEFEHLVELVRLAQAKRLDLSGSITAVMPLDQVHEALEQLAKKIGDPIRIILTP
jgi:D-arabinose 1-dehydrogenase-like Zn-dependent alcohol dehydrogenase